jgi:diadenylate cyclase
MISFLFSPVGIFWILGILFAIAFYFFIRGSFSQNAFIGFLVVISIFYLSSFSMNKKEQLRLINQYAIEIALLSFVMLFSYELKRFLNVWTTWLIQQFENFNFSFSKKKIDLNREELQEIFEACFSLRDSKLGALIVVERKANIDRLDDQKTGIEVDAILSKELLCAIFISRQTNPIHDGAVMIRNHRIHRVGAILPLSEKFDQETTTLFKDEHLGTRHSAAVGIAEKSDAVVFVVSESGKISIAFQNKLHFDLSEDRFMQFLDRFELKSKI